MGERGASWGGQWWPGRGLWVVACWVVTRIGGDKYLKPGESKIDTTGAGAIVRPRGRGGVWVSGWRVVGDRASGRASVAWLGAWGSGRV